MNGVRRPRRLSSSSASSGQNRSGKPAGTRVRRRGTAAAPDPSSAANLAGSTLTQRASAGRSLTARRSGCHAVVSRRRCRRRRRRAGRVGPAVGRALGATVGATVVRPAGWRRRRRPPPRRRRRHRRADGLAPPSAGPSAPPSAPPSWLPGSRHRRPDPPPAGSSGGHVVVVQCHTGSPLALAAPRVKGRSDAPLPGQRSSVTGSPAPRMTRPGTGLRGRTRGMRGPVILVGTSGWQYGDWRGRFLPGEAASAGLAGALRRPVRPVEVNNAFYRLPERDTFAQWRARTPGDFCVAVKMSRYLTHIRRLKDPAEPVTASWSTPPAWVTGSARCSSNSRRT